MVQINTFITKCRDTKFPEIEQLIASNYFDMQDDFELKKCKKNFQVGGTTYISGYIEVSYYGQRYFGEKYKDYIFWLWREIIAGIEDLVIFDKNVEILFPGQPLCFFFSSQSKDQLLFGIKDPSATQEQILLPKQECLLTLISCGLEIFSALNNIIENENNKLMIDNCQKYLQRLT